MLQYVDDLLFVSYESAGRTQRLINLLRGIFEAFGVALSPDNLFSLLSGNVNTWVIWLM